MKTRTEADRPLIWWVRRDLRLQDNPALDAAIHSGKKIIPLFIWAPEEEAPWEPGAASRWWLHYSLQSFAADLEARHATLIIRKGPTLPALRSVLRETEADTVIWNRLYEPAIIERDKRIKAALREDGLHVHSFNAQLLFEPWTIETQQGKPYQVFTPFYRCCQGYGAPETPLPAPRRLPRLAHPPWSAPLPELGLLPALDWADGIQASWTPGEAGAWKRLEACRNEAVRDYKTERDRPDREGTSRLSPHLHFGEISPRQIWHACRAVPNAEPYLRQLIWREFAHHLLYHFPHTTEHPLRPEFARFPWKTDAKTLARWQRGRTGYPIVDAGMRELWRTGWMHNRVRMIVASFLVKDLLIPWQEGARWFWDTLVDANLANNTLGWQWTAGCGADAAPYFRIFNPVLQAVKFDPEGVYVKHWLPVLRGLPAPDIHRIFDLPEAERLRAGIRLGDQYPLPIVDHAKARDEALEAYASLKSPP
ncbi:MAG TPA: deoxyribodipyrimidine photo-lyase [Kiritimatiellia bacterium]|nr:deoxyribodipyrimidine photo-lyase [Kiritimatiellia bacterium]HMP00056.1 deoxyribodipyrimidine photo-lyase [Kiritimatiellia bacterium]HMP96539.1 deoxyribodipyrimidine photo-lyase [Kiritimatiellia bacterium]